MLVEAVITFNAVSYRCFMCSRPADDTFVELALLAGLAFAGRRNDNLSSRGEGVLGGGADEEGSGGEGALTAPKMHKLKGETKERAETNEEGGETRGRAQGESGRE